MLIIRGKTKGYAGREKEKRSIQLSYSFFSKAAVEFPRGRYKPGGSCSCIWPRGLGETVNALSKAIQHSFQLVNAN